MAVGTRYLFVCLTLRKFSPEFVYPKQHTPNNMEPTVTKYLLFAHFAGKTTPLQKRLIEEWLRTVENQEKYYQNLVEWEYQSPQYLPELDLKLADYIHYMEQHPAQEVPDATALTKPPKPVSSLHWIKWLVAASLLVSLGLLGWANKDLVLYIAYRTGFNETKSIELKDGTRVNMNANSVLRVPRFGFGQKTREVLLTGEANFSVTHTIDNQKFIVKADHNLEVVVLGTEFTVYSRHRGSKVVLNKGKVQLRYKEGNASKEVMMKPGDLVTLDPRAGPIFKKPPPRKITPPGPPTALCLKAPHLMN